MVCGGEGRVRGRVLPPRAAELRRRGD